MAGAVGTVTEGAVGTVTEGTVLVAKDAILTAWNWTTAQMRGIVRLQSWAMLEVAMVTLVALLGQQFMTTHVTWIGNWGTNGRTEDVVIQISQIMLSGNDPCVAVCISSGGSRDITKGTG